MYAYLGGTQRSFHGFMSLPPEGEIATQPSPSEVKKWFQGQLTSDIRQ
jgi:hypothetical protein